MTLDIAWQRVVDFLEKLSAPHSKTTQKPAGQDTPTGNLGLMPGTKGSSLFQLEAVKTRDPVEYVPVVFRFIRRTYKKDGAGDLEFPDYEAWATSHNDYNSSKKYGGDGSNVPDYIRIAGEGGRQSDGRYTIGGTRNYKGLKAGYRYFLGVIHTGNRIVQFFKIDLPLVSNRPDNMTAFSYKKGNHLRGWLVQVYFEMDGKKVRDVKGNPDNIYLVDKKGVFYGEPNRPADDMRKTRHVDLVVEWFKEHEVGGTAENLVGDLIDLVT